VTAISGEPSGMVSVLRRGGEGVTDDALTKACQELPGVQSLLVQQGGVKAQDDAKQHFIVMSSGKAKCGYIVNLSQQQLPPAVANPLEVGINQVRPPRAAAVTTRQPGEALDEFGKRLAEPKLDSLAIERELGGRSISIRLDRHNPMHLIIRYCVNRITPTLLTQSPLSANIYGH